MREHLLVHHLILKRSSRNFGHIARLGFQDNMRVCRTRPKSTLHYQRTLVEVSVVRRAFFKERPLSLTDSKCSMSK